MCLPFQFPISRPLLISSFFVGQLHRRWFNRPQFKTEHGGSFFRTWHLDGCTYSISLKINNEQCEGRRRANSLKCCNYDVWELWRAVSDLVAGAVPPWQGWLMEVRLDFENQGQGHGELPGVRNRPLLVVINRAHDVPKSNYLAIGSKYLKAKFTASILSLGRGLVFYQLAEDSVAVGLSFHLPEMRLCARKGLSRALIARPIGKRWPYYCSRPTAHS